MLIATVLLPSLLAAGPSIAWTRDFTAAYAQAEERSRPGLVFFRTNCGGGNTPQNPISGGGPVVHQEGPSPCDRMQQDVWEDQSVIAAVERFTPVLIDGGDQSLAVRYQVVRTPTTLVVDPWGNEILRVSGYFERDRMLRLLRAIPERFEGLAVSGKALRANGADFGALTGAAAFYAEAGLPQVVEQLYGRALNTPRAATPVDTWRQAVIARGLNLMAGLKNGGAAAAVFEAELAAAPEAAGSDALLLGLVNARLSQGKRPEAETAARTLEQKYPASPYATRAKQLLAARPAGS